MLQWMWSNRHFVAYHRSEQAFVLMLLNIFSNCSCVSIWSTFGAESPIVRFILIEIQLIRYWCDAGMQIQETRTRAQISNELADFRFSPLISGWECLRSPGLRYDEFLDLIATLSLFQPNLVNWIYQVRDAIQWIVSNNTIINRFSESNFLHKRRSNISNKHLFNIPRQMVDQWNLSSIGSPSYAMAALFVIIIT